MLGHKGDSTVASAAGPDEGLARSGEKQLEPWMWEWVEWQVVSPGVPCPAGLPYDMHINTGNTIARLQQPQREQLLATNRERAGKEEEHDLPLPPFPPLPQSTSACGVHGVGSLAW